MLGLVCLYVIQLFAGRHSSGELNTAVSLPNLTMFPLLHSRVYSLDIQIPFERHDAEVRMVPYLRKEFAG